MGRTNRRIYEPSVSISVVIPYSLAFKLDRYAHNVGENRSRAISNALEDWFRMLDDQKQKRRDS